MRDLRKAQRSSARQRGKAIISGRSEVVCTIRDVSALGARLSFVHPIFLPRQFRLVFDGEDQRVTVIWQAGILAGVRFQQPIRHAAAPRSRSWPWSRR